MSKFYLTGGMLRNKLLGVAASPDFDFAVESHSFDTLEAALKRRNVNVWQKRPEFVTVRGFAPWATFGTFGGLVKRKKGDHPEGFAADFTLCRAEAMYHDKRHPSVVTPTDLVSDLARRDFTVNALAVSEDGEWFDPYGGTLDADARLLRTVGNADERFAEDPLRMLRAMRFAVAYNLALDADVQKCLHNLHVVGNVQTLPKERVMDELNKAFKYDWARTMQFLFVQYPSLGAAVSPMGLKLKATT